MQPEAWHITGFTLAGAALRTAPIFPFGLELAGRVAAVGRDDVCRGKVGGAITGAPGEPPVPLPVRSPPSEVGPVPPLPTESTVVRLRVLMVLDANTVRDPVEVALPNRVLPC